MAEKHVRIKTVFLDMDGVLVDFIGNVLFSHKKSLKDEEFEIDGFMEAWPAAEWDVSSLLGYPDQQEFWRVVESDPDFWANCWAYSWADQIIDAAMAIGDVRLLSSPTENPSCWSGKKRVRDSRFQDIPLILCKEKHYLAAPDRLLIDDNDQNVAYWRKHGGSAILFPQVWNTNHAWRNSPMVYVGMELARMGIIKAETAAS